MLLLLFLLALTSPPPRSCETVAQIQAAALKTDARAKQSKPRSFAEIKEGAKLRWREVKKFPEDSYSLANYFADEKGHPRVAGFTFSSESGDWTLFVNYYFRPDGTLAKKDERLNTFYGRVSVLREKYFDCDGQTLKKSIRYLDLETNKETKPDGDFIDESSPTYKTTKDLPFFSLLTVLH